MKKRYDVVIIGAGPAGLTLGKYLHKHNIDFIIIDQGEGINKRFCIRDCDKCKNPTCAIINGVGGAGFFSDGKFNFSFNIGGAVEKVLSKKVYLNAINYIINDFNLTIKNPKTKLIKEFNDKYKNYCHMVGIKQSHIGSDKLPSFVNKLTSNFNHKIITNTKVNDLSLVNGLFKIMTTKGLLETEVVVIATGQAGSAFAINIAKKNNIKITRGVADIGIRIEIPSKLFESIIKIQYDPKIYFHTTFGVVRTFCTNPNGYIITENKGKYVSVNGYSNNNKKSDKTNFALMFSLSDLDDPKSFTEELCEKISLSNNYKLITEDINLFRTNSKIKLFYPKKVFDSLIESVNYLELIIGNKLTGTVYAPEVKLYNENIAVEKDTFKSIVDNLYFIGDCIGWIHGITNACVSGLVAAKSIVKQLKNKQKIKFLSWNDYEIMINKIKTSIINKGLKPKLIFGISRGGLVPAVNFAHLFNCKEIGVINLSKNETDNFFEINKQRYPRLKDSILPHDKEGLIMIVDDIVGYGDTIREAYKLIKNNYPNSKIIKVSLIVNEERLNEKGIKIDEVVDFYSMKSDKKTWIVFPWEKTYETNEN